MKKIKELDFVTRLKIAKSMKYGRVKINSICKEYGISRTAATNIGLLFDQYGEPSLRDSSMTLNSKPSNIVQNAQEMIVTIVLNHIQLELTEIRKIIEAEGVLLGAKQVHRFLTQVGLANEELREQYLEELREISDAKATFGIQKFAHDKFGILDGRDMSKESYNADEQHYLLFEITLNPNVKPGKTARLLVLLNIFNLQVAVIVNDNRYFSQRQKSDYKRFLRLRTDTYFNKSIELYLWHENHPDKTNATKNRVFLEYDLDSITAMNEIFQELYGDGRLSFGSENEHFDAKISFKLGFLKMLRETIEDSRRENTENGDTGQIALEHSLNRIQESIVTNNSESITRVESRKHPKDFKVNLGLNSQENPVVKLSDLVKRWIDSQSR